ncbi:methyltransferase domain-containing protein [Candidatus Woesearchaeota archaeon]|nr:methyltransferase domain-containing protein [Candidatus Woesearchaeota archaeon]
MLDSKEDKQQKQINRWYTLVSKLYNYSMKKNEFPLAREELIERLNIAPNDRVIEIGTGNGKNLAYYPKNAEYYCTDINPKMIQKAKKRARKINSLDAHFIQANAKKLRFEDNFFDKAILTYALSAIPNNEQALAEIKRVVKPGGHIGIIDFTNLEPLCLGGVAGINLYNLTHDQEGLNITHKDVINPWVQRRKDHQMMYILKVE